MKIYFEQNFLCRRALAICALVIISGCSSAPSSRYSLKQDRAPNFDYGEIVYQLVEPTRETPNTWTSRPYTINGQQYFPMQSAKGVSEVGQASWYGEKFHGHTTANGEVFDMFALTAAHKTLPLPSYVKVTNLQTNESVIVRVNDRGPFHNDRILDLSYGAAKKLGFHKYGVTDVKMDVIYVQENGDITIGNDSTVYISQSGQLVKKPYTPFENTSDRDTLITQNSITDKAFQSTTELKDNKSSISFKTAEFAANTISNKAVSEFDEVNLAPSLTGLFVQVLALQNKEKAENLATGIAKLLQVPTITPKTNDIYKLHIGPLNSEQKAKQLIQELKKIGFDDAFTVQLMP